MPITINGGAFADGEPLPVNGVQAESVTVNGVEIWKNKTFEVTQFTMTVGFHLFYANEVYGFNSYALLMPEFGATAPDPLLIADGSRVAEGGTQGANPDAVYFISSYMQDLDYFPAGTYKIQIEGYISEEATFTEETAGFTIYNMKEAYDLIRASLDQTLNCAIHYMAP